MSKKSKVRELLPPLDQNQRYAVEETLAYLRTSRSYFYTRYVNTGRIKLIKEGGRCYVPGSEIARLSSVDAAA
jgi:hypothetical protein